MRPQGGESRRGGREVVQGCGFVHRRHLNRVGAQVLHVHDALPLYDAQPAEDGLPADLASARTTPQRGGT